MQNNIEAKETTQSLSITPEALLEHWQGHRRLTRRVIAAFPEEHFFTYRLGGMRSFADLIEEVAGLATGAMDGIITGTWSQLANEGHFPNGQKPQSKAETLQIWDDITQKIDSLWKLIPPERFNETILAFGMYEGTVYSTLQYLFDNEIHHRGQAYVYLRTLGVEPPPFWDRQES